MNNKNNRLTLRLTNKNLTYLQKYKNYTLNSYNSIINRIIFEYFNKNRLI